MTSPNDTNPRKSLFRYLSRTLYRWSPITVIIALVALTQGKLALTVAVGAVAVLQLAAAAWFASRARAEPD